MFRAHDPMAQRLTDGVSKDSNTTLVPKRRPRAVAWKAFGAIALGAAAIGALAIGTLAIGRLAIGRARIGRLEIDELVVRRTRVSEGLQTPPKPGPEC